MDRAERTVRVWVDDANPVFRRGLACCLREGGFVLSGESCGFVPEPDLAEVDVLVFDLGEGELEAMLARARDATAGPTRLLGLVRSGGLPGEGTQGMCTVLDRDRLTVEGFLDCLCSLTGAPRTATITPADVELLQLLADGGTPASIAGDLGSTEDAVRSVLADLLARMRCRNSAQAVARALREGVI